MNPNKIITNLRGDFMPKSFPSSEEVEKLPKLEDGTPDLSKLENETVSNILINCLTNYIVKDTKESYYVNTIAQLLLSSDEKIELKDKLKNFLIKVLYDMILREEKEVDDKGVEKKVVKGLYSGWAMVQILEEFGVKNEEE